MPEYTLIIEIPNAGNKEFRNTVNLKGHYVDCPKDYFGDQENRTKLRDDIERQSARQVSDADLEFFIKEWCRDIKQGLSPTEISRELPPLVTPLGISQPSTDSSGDKKGNYINRNSGYHTPKQPNPPGGSGTSSDGKNQSGNTGNTQHKNSEQTQNDADSQTETRATTNEVDF